MKSRMRLAVLLILCLVFLVSAQSSQNTEILVSSWMKGTEKITEQSLKINLTPEKAKYEINILGNSGKVYKLRIVPNYFNNLKDEHWKIELREISSNEDNELLGDDLLFAERPGEGGDNFPKENFAAFFFPNVKNSITINGNDWVEGAVPLYPLEATRKIKVEGFFVILKAGNIKLSQNNSKIDSFEIFIEFVNTCGRHQSNA